MYVYVVHCTSNRDVIIMDMIDYEFILLKTSELEIYSSEVYHL